MKNKKEISFDDKLYKEIEEAIESAKDFSYGPDGGYETFSVGEATDKVMDVIKKYNLRPSSK